ncbi:MAG TPA: hypothetical protein VGE47_15765 [Burkholderiaceae bacterium]
MNTTHKALIFATIATAAVSAMAAFSAPKPVQLERVVIIGKRMNVDHVAQLPRVVIEGRSQQATLLAQAAVCNTATC